MTANNASTGRLLLLLMVVLLQLAHMIGVSSRHMTETTAGVSGILTWLIRCPLQRTTECQLVCHQHSHCVAALSCCCCHQVGVIERPCVGLFGNPELKAFREEGPRQPLYR
jgi:hypothetical protein